MTIPDNIAVFGATGRTGRQVLTAARADGLIPRCLVRSGGTVESTGATEIVGDLESAGPIVETLYGCTAAILVFGPRPPYTEIFCARATRQIVLSMTELGVNRIICQTGAMIGDCPNNRTWPFQMVSRWYQRRQVAPHQDRVDQEEIVRDSGLRWTVVKPPRLTEGTGRAALAAGPAVRIGLLSSVARGALARFLVSEAMDPCFIGETVFVRRGRGA